MQSSYKARDTYSLQTCMHNHTGGRAESCAKRYYIFITILFNCGCERIRHKRPLSYIGKLVSTHLH